MFIFLGCSCFCMDIDVTFDGENRVYSLVLSRRDFDDICSGFSDGGAVVGAHRQSRVYFSIMEGSSIGDMWRRMSDGYYLQVGVPIPVPSVNPTAAEYDVLATQYFSSLEQAINNSGRIPLEGDLIGGVRTDLGYVVMRVAPE